MNTEERVAAINASAQMVCKALELHGPRIFGGTGTGATAGAAVADAFKAIYQQVQASAEGR